MDVYRCCICGDTFEGFGNNPWPIVYDEKARCCDDCNATVVIPARLERLENDESESR